jgi:hypothetical protein
MSRSIRNPRALVCLFTVLTLLTAVHAPGQTFRGTILGVVTDSSGAAVPGATVTIKNVDTGLSRTVTTTDDGSYSAPELPIGNYSVTVEKSGDRNRVHVVEDVETRESRARCSRGSWHKSRSGWARTCALVDTTSNTLGGLIRFTESGHESSGEWPRLSKLPFRSPASRFSDPDYRLARLVRHFSVNGASWPRE